MIPRDPLHYNEPKMVKDTQSVYRLFRRYYVRSFCTRRKGHNWVGHNSTE